MAISQIRLLTISVTALRVLHEPVWISAYSPANGHELCDIKSALAEFEFRHERLTPSKALSKLDLRDAVVLASLHKQLDHS